MLLVIVWFWNVGLNIIVLSVVVGGVIVFLSFMLFVVVCLVFVGMLLLLVLIGWIVGILVFVCIYYFVVFFFGVVMKI